MKIDKQLKVLLGVIAMFLGVIAFRPYVASPPVMAGSSDIYPLYVEPGVSMLRAPDGSRQMLGKVIIDMRNGNIWGFPTLSQDPYPAASATNGGAPISRPFLLGKFALADTDK